MERTRTLNDEERKKFFYLTGLKPTDPLYPPKPSDVFFADDDTSSKVSPTSSSTSPKTYDLDTQTSRGDSNIPDESDTPIGSPRTSRGANANPNPDTDDTLARQLADQIENPVQLGGVTLKKIHPPPNQGDM